MATGGQLLVEQLRRLGVDAIFTVPGESFLAVLDALHDVPEVRLIVCRHEAGAANMAEAYGKLTSRPGVCLVTRGPGAAHASIGVHTARHDSTPMILLIGQVARAHRGREAFQEVEFTEMFRPLAKATGEISEARCVPEEITRAHATALAPRRGPVVLSLPEDMLVEEADAAFLEPEPVVEPEPEEDAVALARAMLSEAERPLVILGGGAWSQQAGDNLSGWAEASGVPLVTAFRRQDYVDNTAPAFVGYTGIATDPTLARRIEEVDVLVALGARLQDASTGSYSFVRAPSPVQRLVHVYPDPSELGRVYDAEVPVIAGAAAFTKALAAADPLVRDRGWAARLRAEYEAGLEPRKAPGALDMAAVVIHLRERLPADAIVTNGAGNFSVWAHRYYQFRRFGTQLAPTSGAMGYAVPAAVAAKLARPEATTVAFAGDGDFMMSASELATAVQYETPFVVLVINNGMYGTIRMHQEREYPGRVIGTELRNPDFVQLARSFGAYGELVERTEDFPAAFERALEAKMPAVLELRVDPEALTPRATLSEIREAARARSHLVEAGGSSGAAPPESSSA